MSAITDNGAPSVNGSTSRPRLVVALTFPVHPATGGGQVRALNLSRALSSVYDVELVSLVGAKDHGGRRRVAAGVWETRVPKSTEHASAETELERDAGTVVTDVAMSDLHTLTPAYADAVRRAADGARAVVACHPYPFPAIRAATDAPVWYEAQDVEASLKRHVLGDSGTARRLLARAEAVESECCQQAEFVLACSEEDRQELVGRYGPDPDRVLVVPNGVALDEASYVSFAERAARRRRLRIADKVTAVFVASWHEPNLVAARALLDVAHQVPRAEFIVVGSVGLALQGDRCPANVQLTGTVDLAFKQDLLGTADLALNPVTTGSGTNLKMLDYFAAGIPVVSTAFGARGLGVEAGRHYVEAEPRALRAAVAGWRQRDPAMIAEMVEAARDHVERRMSWDAIGGELLAALQQRRAVL